MNVKNYFPIIFSIQYLSPSIVQKEIEYNVVIEYNLIPLCVIWIIHRWLNHPGNICIIYHNWNWFQDRGTCKIRRVGGDVVWSRCTDVCYATVHERRFHDANTFVIGTILTNRLIHRVSQFEYTHAISLEAIFNFYHRALIFDEGENRYFPHIECKIGYLSFFWYSFFFFLLFSFDNWQFLTSNLEQRSRSILIKMSFLYCEYLI